MHAVLKRRFAASKRQLLSVSTDNAHDTNRAGTRSMVQRLKGAKRRNKKSHLARRFKNCDLFIKIKGLIVDIRSHFYSPCF